MSRLLNRIYRSTRQQVTDWTIRQLRLEPYQYLLEVGCGSGKLLSEVAQALKPGFIAGVESSLPKYRQAHRRNRTYIEQERMQLHIGEVSGLPYPAHYFHTIYGTGIHDTWKNDAAECLRLTTMLRIGGRLVLFTKPWQQRHHDDIRTEAARLQAACYAAGLTDIHTEYRDFASGACLAVAGFKPDNYIDYQSSVAVNNRLLNSKASFISKIARTPV